MLEEDYFNVNNSLSEDNYKVFLRFAGDLGYPEFGISEGIRTCDFSHLPNSDLIDFDDLNPNILMDLPSAVKNFIRKEIPDLYHQIMITLSQKDLSKDTRVFVNRFTDYLRYLNTGKRNPIQRDYNFLNYVVAFASKPSVFECLLNQIAKDNEVKLLQWQILLEELIDFSSDFDACKKFAAQIITETTSYKYSEQLQSSIRVNDWTGYLPVKLVKNILDENQSFIEIGGNLTYFSVKKSDLPNIEAYDKFKSLMPRIKVVFPEIESVFFDEDGFYERKILVISYNSITDIRKKAFNSLISYILNKNNVDLNADRINDFFFSSVESFLTINDVFEKNSSNPDGLDSTNFKL